MTGSSRQTARFALAAAQAMAPPLPFPYGTPAAQAVAPAPTDPVTDAIAGERAHRGAKQRVRPRQFAQPDQHAHREQQRQRRHDGAQDDHRVAEGDGEDHQPCGHGMRADPGQQVVEPGGFHRRIIGGGT